MPRSEVLPRPGQKFWSSFLLQAHRCSASGTSTSGTRASPKPGNSPKKWASEGSTEWVQIRRPKRKNTNEIQWQMKNEWKNTAIWKAKGKAMDANTDDSPGYQSQPNSLETHLVTKWGDIGHQRALSPWINGWMDGNFSSHSTSHFQNLKEFNKMMMVHLYDFDFPIIMLSMN